MTETPLPEPPEFTGFKTQGRLIDCIALCSDLLSLIILNLSLLRPDFYHVSLINFLLIVDFEVNKL